MYRRISVHLDHGFDCPRRTRVALTLARRHQAELVGIYASSAPPQYYYGESVMLDAGGEVQVVQQLGGSITVRTELGLLLRVDGTAAAALRDAERKARAAQRPSADANDLAHGCKGHRRRFPHRRYRLALRRLHPHRSPVVG